MVTTKGKASRPHHFPHHPALERLLASDYDPEIAPFTIEMQRRNARDLRKVLFGPKGVRKVPKFDGDLHHYNGEMEFDLPNGWRLRLTYEVPPYEIEAGDVIAEFIPPVIREARSIPQEAPVTRWKRRDADSWLARE